MKFYLFLLSVLLLTIFGTQVCIAEDPALLEGQGTIADDIKKFESRPSLIDRLALEREQRQQKAQEQPQKRRRFAKRVPAVQGLKRQ
ncbi:hypothetical protein J3Q64DRAFT_1846785 [Phycomyces blakesleeanus]|uniref:Uncharacterized protein n=2 Tax=Phycomyces blakesleeanus TaxID=4837 RepID=A0A167R867_PHYB8|nr:hypothetical protein PHYBLDRAFT_178854 [Phycomyces blakesleeanus NRRL 1555(-)]OAD81078.1 hypothetical protein PHYBLDRAFT_178854 [Phycomyces blakesleeanus NRRL 1555(-)]|eukprot:XP_018299118.1 hypothetical protein PHYBLDRAFT_178854 [Phycomyces blakesleeanus NRRL 1555(-)]